MAPAIPLLRTSTMTEHDNRQPPPEVGFCTSEQVLESLVQERESDRRRLRLAVLFAVLFHTALLAVTLPDFGTRAFERPSRPRKVFLVQQPRFQPPPPQKAQAPKPQEKRKRIPVPDPTPDDPEPIEVPEVNVPEIDLLELGPDVFGIPDRPPGGPGLGESGPVHVTGGISPPLKIYYPPPRFTEEARQARLQGAVLLQAVIDTEGNVTRLKVLKGLPLGLTDMAVETAATWKFKPALRDGKPAAVYFHLLINFRLQ